MYKINSMNCTVNRFQWNYCFLLAVSCDNLYSP